MKNKKLVFISLVVMATLIVTIIGIGYAWFNAIVTTSGNNSVIVDAAELGTITYYTGNEINVDGIYPGWCETKRVSIVSNNATVSNSYVINLNVVTNELAANGGTQGYINIKSTTVAGTTGTGSLPVTDIKTTSGQIGILRGTLPANGTHTYDIEFCFPERGSNQNSQQGKAFNAYITVELNYFAQDTWDVIVKNVQSGNTDRYNVGDTKEVDMGSLGVHTLRIANKTTTADCADSNTSYSQTACGFVLEFADILNTQHVMSTQTRVNAGGWAALTAEVGGMRAYVNDDIYNALPDELIAGIIDTRVISSHGSTPGETNFTTTDKLYLLSPVEIYGRNNTYDSVTTTETRQLDYYNLMGVTSSNYKGVIKQINGSPDNWGLRTACLNNTTSFYFVSNTGYGKGTNVSSSWYGVSPAFRIG